MQHNCLTTGMADGWGSQRSKLAKPSVMSEFQKVPLEMSPGPHLDPSDSGASGYFRFVTGWGKCSYKTPLVAGSRITKS